MFLMTILPINIIAAIPFAAIASLCPVCFWWTAGLVERARWILIFQSYSPGYDPDEQWWKRLMKQFANLQDRTDLTHLY